MASLKELNKPQRIYITLGMIFTTLIIFGVCNMLFFYSEFNNNQFFEKDEDLAIEIIIGWCVFSYLAYWFNSVVLEYIWVTYSKTISHSDLTLEFLNIDVRAIGEGGDL